MCWRHHCLPSWPTPRQWPNGKCSMFILDINLQQLMYSVEAPLAAKLKLPPPHAPTSAQAPPPEWSLSLYPPPSLPSPNLTTAFLHGQHRNRCGGEHNLACMMVPAAAAAATMSTLKQQQQAECGHTCGASRKPRAPNTTPPITKPARKLESLLRLSALQHKFETHTRPTGTHAMKTLLLDAWEHKRCRPLGVMHDPMLSGT